MTGALRIVLPSKGEMEAPTLAFLAAAGLGVSRPNPRQYVAMMPAVPAASVVFQRANDIAAKVIEGSADLGITGLDNVRETQLENDPLLVVIEDLGYSGCELVLAVPDTWIDVATVGDLADLATELRESGRDLRIATKYRRLTRDFLLRRGISHFSLVASQGAMEAAPSIGYADIIADLTSSGTTLRENHLKTIDGGTILRSQACLIANRETLQGCASRVAGTRKILELIEARMRAASFLRVTANIRGASEQDVADQIWARPELAGLAGPTVSRVYGQGPDRWYAVALVVRADLLLPAVEHLRAVGGSGVTVLPTTYVFEDHSYYFGKLQQELEPTATRTVR
ncbi:MAG: ATP phosphoribosyltransferase [Dehalococcoidia bacterium]